MSVTINGTTGVSKTQPSSAPWLTGMIIAFGNETAPEGWLSCDGSAVSRETYDELFAKVGTKWGVGDGTTTFNVPDLRGFAPVGTGTNDLDIDPGDPTVGKFEGPAVGDLRRDQFQGHGHRSVLLTVSSAGGGATPLPNGNSTPENKDTYITDPLTLGSNGTPRIGTTTHGPEAGVLYCIKT